MDWRKKASLWKFLQTDLNIHGSLKVLKFIYILYNLIIICLTVLYSVCLLQFSVITVTQHNAKVLFYWLYCLLPQRGGNRDTILLQGEAYWIPFLYTLIPEGLDEQICFLWYKHVPCGLCYTASFYSVEICLYGTLRGPLLLFRKVQLPIYSAVFG